MYLARSELEAGNALVGVGLTAVSRRPGPEDPATTRRWVNLSSWYIVPEHRWKTPLLLREMMADPDAIYTDLTPTPDVQRMMPSLGFSALNDGVEVGIVPCLALAGATRWRVSLWGDEDDQTTAHHYADLMADHRRWGCHTLAIRHESGPVPLILRTTRLSRIPIAKAIFCPSPDVLHEAIAAVSRYLLARGIPLLLADRPTTGGSPKLPLAIKFAQRRRRFGKNVPTAAGIDYAYSELVYFDL